MKIAGKSVVDATRKLKIHITNRDVKLGDTKDPAACAAARALCRETKCTQARVHISRTYLRIGNKWVRYETPQALRFEIVAFDRGGTFEPGEYTLAAVRPSHREGMQQGSSKQGKNRPTKRIRHVVTGIRPHGANR